jgi:hypothetical protein
MYIKTDEMGEEECFPDNNLSTYLVHVTRVMKY